MENNDFNEVALRMKELRESCDTTQEELAEKLSVSLECYQGYEDGSVDIPISILYKVVNIFDVDLTELLTGNSPKLDTYCVVRSGQGVSVDRYPGYKYKSVGFNFLHRKMEPLIVDIDFEEDSNPDKVLITHSGQEYNYVIEGTMKLTLGTKEVILSRGDSCYFDAMIPHGQNAVGEAARFLTVILE